MWRWCSHDKWGGQLLSILWLSRAGRVGCSWTREKPCWNRNIVHKNQVYYWFWTDDGAMANLLNHCVVDCEPQRGDPVKQVHRRLPWLLPRQCWMWSNTAQMLPVEPKSSRYSHQAWRTTRVDSEAAIGMSAVVKYCYDMQPRNLFHMKGGTWG